MDLKSQLEAYQPFNEQEEKDRIEILRRLTSEEIYTRDNHGAHLTASAWVVSKDYAHVLMCYHKIYCCIQQSGKYRKKAGCRMSSRFPRIFSLWRFCAWTGMKKEENMSPRICI